MRKVVLLTVLILGTMAVRAANGCLYLGVGAVGNSVTDITGPYGAVAPIKEHFVEGLRESASAQLAGAGGGLSRSWQHQHHEGRVYGRRITRLGPITRRGDSYLRTLTTARCS